MTSVCGKRGLVGPGLAVSDIVDKAAAPWTRVRMLEIMEQPAERVKFRTEVKTCFFL